MKDQTGKPGKTITLDDAYALKGRDEARRLYEAWAESYDREFAQACDYRTPDILAGVYAETCTDPTAPVLDVGAGTGLVAEGLAARGNFTVDALDICEKMLGVASQKGLYRNLILGDLTATLPIADASYGGFTSTGTFTYGHVGPEALDELIRIGRPGALYVLGIKAAIYQSAGFAAKFDSLAGEIRGFRIVEKAGYGENATPELQQSLTAMAVFHKAG